MNIGHFGRLSQALPTCRPIEQRNVTLLYLTEVITLSAAVNFELITSKYFSKIWLCGQNPYLVSEELDGVWCLLQASVLKGGAMVVIFEMFGNGCHPRWLLGWWTTCSS